MAFSSPANQCKRQRGNSTTTSCAVKRPTIATSWASSNVTRVEKGDRSNHRRILDQLANLFEDSTRVADDLKQLQCVLDELWLENTDLRLENADLRRQKQEIEAKLKRREKQVGNDLGEANQSKQDLEKEKMRLRREAEALAKDMYTIAGELWNYNKPMEEQVRITDRC
ncbi:MAG: hypothetical protein M1825_003442 [Sarcosagium campestre]|nr:MAG: hypothetical protein M1825_003442 [Sarcosagium campestre]